MQRLAVTDGLRAIAVMAVVLFHTYPQTLPGGFIGVDIFFVISGFIISLVYNESLINGSISFPKFYTRRVRRLAPAYIVVVIATTIAAFAIMLPRDLSNFALSLSFQAFYAQNIAFWIIGDYFEGALAKPLLHTWSLAVEEQFYFFLPALILILRRKRAWGHTVVLALLMGSLAIGWVVAGVSPKTSFYWLPTRIWEFTAGILAASLYRREIIPARWTAPSFYVGLALIFSAIALFGEASRFPGPQSLIAVAGSTFLLLGQNASTFGTRVMLTRQVQWVGRISYSWYLWHWPPLSLWFILHGQPASGLHALGLATFGLVAGALSYHYIERPVARSSALLVPRQALTTVLCFAAFAVTGSLTVFHTDGFIKPYSARTEILLRAQLDVPPYRCPLTRRMIAWRDDFCQLNNEKGGSGILLIGDSHADRTKTVLAELADDSHTRLYLTKQNCRLSDYGFRSDCQTSILPLLRDEMKRTNIHLVVAVSHWPDSLSREERDQFARNITALGVPVIIQLPTPSAVTFDPTTRLATPSDKIDNTSVTRKMIMQNTQIFRSAVRDIAASNHNVTYIDPLPILCPNFCLTIKDGSYLYRDQNHLTLKGVSLLKPLYYSSIHNLNSNMASKP